MSRGLVPSRVRFDVSGNLVSDECLLQRVSRVLTWIAKIDEGNEREIGAHEYQVGLPLQMIDKSRCDHDDDKVLGDE